MKRTKNLFATLVLWLAVIMAAAAMLATAPRESKLGNAESETETINLFDMTTSLESEKDEQAVKAVGSLYTIPLHESDTGKDMIYAGYGTFTNGYETKDALAKGATTPRFNTGNLFVLAFKVPADTTVFELGGVFNIAADPVVGVSGDELGLAGFDYADNDELAAAFGKTNVKWSSVNISTSGYGGYIYGIESPGEEDYYVYIICNGTSNEYFGVTGSGEFNIQGNLTASHNGTVWSKTPTAASYNGEINVTFTEGGTASDYLLDTYMMNSNDLVTSYNWDTTGGNIQANGYDGGYKIFHLDEEGSRSVTEARRPSYWVKGQYAVFMFDLSAYAEKNLSDLTLTFSELYSTKIDVAFASDLSSVSGAAYSGTVSDYTGGNVADVVEAAQNLFACAEGGWTNLYGSITPPNGTAAWNTVSLNISSLYESRASGEYSNILFIRLSSNAPYGYAGQTVNTTGILNALKLNFNFDDPVQSISVSASRTEYGVGDSIDLTSITLTVVKESGATETVSVTTEMISGFDSSAEGEITVTVTYEDYTDTLTLTIVDLTKITGITISNETLSLAEGGNASLTATVEGGSRADLSVTWTSSDETVATVSSDGTVTAVSAGTATITATASDGTTSATCTVTVTEVAIDVTSVTLSAETLSLTEGDSGTLTATVLPNNATYGAITWSSSDTSVATVSSDGTVTAVGAGTATITATAGGVSATCAVTVAAASSDDPSTDDPSTDDPSTEDPSTDDPSDETSKKSGCGSVIAVTGGSMLALGAVVLAAATVVFAGRKNKNKLDK